MNLFYGLAVPPAKPPVKTGLPVVFTTGVGAVYAGEATMPPGVATICTPAAEMPTDFIAAAPAIADDALTNPVVVLTTGVAAGGKTGTLGDIRGIAVKPPVTGPVPGTAGVITGGIKGEVTGGKPGAVGATTDVGNPVKAGE